MLSIHADGQDIVVSAFVQHGLFDHRARRHHADDIALDQSFGCRRIFHLFADCNLIALFNQPIDIGNKLAYISFA